MFIREIEKKDPESKKSYVCHRLMESVRTAKGPRQRIVLNLGRLELAREEWKALANRIEEILTGQQRLQSAGTRIEELARRYARLIRGKEMQNVPVMPQKTPEQDMETVDLNSITHEEIRTIGGEAIGWWAFKELDIDGILKREGFNKHQAQLAALLIIGRLLHPGSERETVVWGRRMSGLSEILGTDFERLSNNAVYRISDALIRKKEEIEREKERFTPGDIGSGAR